MEGEHKLFVCFTSRQSSMRLGPKCSLSPGREKLRESSSRRLRSNGSTKGHSSPMFPVLIPYNLTGRKKNTGFETQEPSSPKVTCIGQVRVKSRQSKRLNSGSKVSGVRHEECSRKWGHIFRKEVSFNICEALRSFGAEFNCFVPCGGTSHPPKESKESTTCGAMFAKWFMVLQEDDRKGREVEEPSTALDVPGPRALDNEIDSRVLEEDMVHSRAQQGLDESDIVKICEPSRPSIKGKEDADFDIVIPPRNALLLMRCRSDPLRMSAMVEEMRSRLEPVRKSSAEAERRDFVIEDDGEDEVEDDRGFVLGFECRDEDKKIAAEALSEDEEVEAQSVANKDSVATSVEQQQKEHVESPQVSGREVETEESVQPGDDVVIDKIDGENGDSELHTSEVEVQATVKGNEATSQDFAEKETETSSATVERGSQPHAEKCDSSNAVAVAESVEEKSTGLLGVTESLPEALLLMMYEPKLSMEISKETWVSKEDFVRRPVGLKDQDKKKDGLKDPDKKKDENKANSKSNEPVMEEPRTTQNTSSVAESMNCVKRGSVDEKVHDATTFVLPRCKSEPLRASVKLVPEACFWKPRNFEIPALNIKIGARLGF